MGLISTVCIIILNIEYDWEAVDNDGSGFAHSFTLKETKEFIDCELDGDNK